MLCLFDTGSLVPDMTYNVFGGTLNTTHSLMLLVLCLPLYMAVYVAAFCSVMKL